MGWTEKVIAKQNGKDVTRYKGRYRLPDGSKRTVPGKAYTRKKDALAAANRMEEALMRGDWVDPQAGKLTLDDYYATWKLARTVKQSTIETQDERYRSLIQPCFGGLPLKAILHDDIKAWSASMKAYHRDEVASESRRKAALGLLSLILDSAVDGDLIPRNPAKSRSGKMKYQPRAVKQKEHRYLSIGELFRLASATESDQDRNLILFAGLTGLRWGELVALQRGDLDLITMRARVNRAVSTSSKGILTVGSTKTHARRSVPIRHVIEVLGVEWFADKAEDEWLFTSEQGGLLDRRNYSSREFANAVKVASNAVSTLQDLLGSDAEKDNGEFSYRTAAALKEFQATHSLIQSGICDWATWNRLESIDRERRDGMTRAQKLARTKIFKRLKKITLRPEDKDFARLTFHDLRHTASSVAVASGATVKVVQTMLGHESASMTLDTYAGLFDKDLDTVSDAMSESIAKSLPPICPLKENQPTSLLLAG